MNAQHRERLQLAHETVEAYLKFVAKARDKESNGVQARIRAIRNAARALEDFAAEKPSTIPAQTCRNIAKDMRMRLAYALAGGV